MERELTAWDLIDQFHKFLNTRQRLITQKLMVPNFKTIIFIEEKSIATG